MNDFRVTYVQIPRNHDSISVHHVSNIACCLLRYPKIAQKIAKKSSHGYVAVLQKNVRHHDIHTIVMFNLIVENQGISN